MKPATKRLRGEPPAPTPLDEVMSSQSLDCAPWIRQRIKELRIEGKPAKTWKPPTFRLCSDGDVTEW